MFWTGDYIWRAIEELESEIAETKAEIANCPSGNIQREHRREKEIYYLTEAGQKRKVINDQGKINGIVRREYLKSKIEVLEHNERLLRRLLAGFIDPNDNSYIERMPKHLRELCAQEPADDWANEEYKMSTYYADLKRHKTSRGLMVRSKSEVIIAEKLYEYDVPFRYEQLLDVKGCMYAPDFTVLNRRTGQEFYWEHFGLMNDEKYVKAWRLKLYEFEQAGISPWTNLITTYDKPNNSIDLQMIEYIIKCKLL